MFQKNYNFIIRVLYKIKREKNNHVTFHTKPVHEHKCLSKPEVSD